MKISIVIPASGSQTNIDDTLVSVLENRPTSCEILLAHPEAYVDPYQLDDEIRLVPCPQSDTLSLLNWGCLAANGDVIHTLCPGIMATAGWCEAAMDAFYDDVHLGSLAPTISLPQGHARVCGIRYHAGQGKEFVSKSRRRVLAPLIQSGFYLRAAMHFMRGFDPQYGDLADVELGLRMYSADYRAIASDAVHVESSLAIKPQTMRGFRAGQIRGRLFHQAKSFGLATSQGLALCGEPLRNGFGLGAFTGLMGRLACGSAERSDTLELDAFTEPASHRHAA